MDEDPSGPLVKRQAAHRGPAVLQSGHRLHADHEACAASPIVLVTNKDVPAKTLKDLVAYAKANPGALNVGNSGLNSTQELMSMMFASGTGIEITRVPYKGARTRSFLDILANRIQLMLDTFRRPIWATSGQGDLRFLATLNATRLESASMCRPLPKRASPRRRRGGAGSGMSSARRACRMRSASGCSRRSAPS